MTRTYPALQGARIAFYITGHGFGHAARMKPIIDRLAAVGGTTGHAEQLQRYDYDSVCTAIDTEIYKWVALEMLQEAGGEVLVRQPQAAAVRGAVLW